MAEIITKDRKEYNIWDKINSKWNRLNFWHKASDCEFNDGKTAQTKLGAIDGITSDLSGESETVAASIKCVNQLNSSLGDISNVGNSTYNSVEKLLKYYIDNGYLPDVNMILLTGTVFASSTYSASFSPDNAFNYDSSSGWLPAAGSEKTDYIGLTLEKQYTIKKATLELSGSGSSISPYVVLQGSNDNSTWNNISSSIALVSTKKNYEIISTSEIAYKYVRLYFNPTICVSGSSQECMTVITIKFYGA